MKKKIQLTEKQLKTIIEKVLYENGYSDNHEIGEEETHGYPYEPYISNVGDSMSFEGWKSETVPSGIGGGTSTGSGDGGSSDFSSDYDSDFDLSESFRKNLRKLL